MAKYPIIAEVVYKSFFFRHQDLGSRNLVFQKRKKGKCAASIVERVRHPPLDGWCCVKKADLTGITLLQRNSPRVDCSDGQQTNALVEGVPVFMNSSHEELDASQPKHHFDKLVSRNLDQDFHALVLKKGKPMGVTYQVSY